ncbi:MAG: hypothetical protein NT074_01685 [Methanomicrobiales archaeon]|nr:hypothetical protein [Methanomicrobiales archaeon]
MDPLNPHDELKFFLKTRKTEKSRFAARSILVFLQQKKNLGCEWIRASELQAFFSKPGSISDSSLFQLLRDMQDKGLIEHKEQVEMTDRSSYKKEKVSSYYKTIVDILGDKWVKDSEIMGVTAKYKAEKGIAIDLLKKMGCKDPISEIQRRFDEKYGVQIIPDELTKPPSASRSRLPTDEARPGPPSVG